MVGAMAVAAVFVVGSPGGSESGQQAKSATKEATATTGNDTIAGVAPSLQNGATSEIDNSMVETLAGDARGGLRYVLRVSGLKSVDRQ